MVEILKIFYFWSFLSIKMKYICHKFKMAVFKMVAPLVYYIRGISYWILIINRMVDLVELCEECLISNLTGIPRINILWANLLWKMIWFSSLPGDIISWYLDTEENLEEFSAFSEFYPLYNLRRACLQEHSQYSIRFLNFRKSL